LQQLSKKEFLPKGNISLTDFLEHKCRFILLIHDDFVNCRGNLTAQKIPARHKQEQGLKFFIYLS
jgi:hypothetical protein